MMRLASFLTVMFLVCAGAFAQTSSSSSDAPGAAAPSGRSLPNDRHDGMSVSADAYTDAARAKVKFSKANPLPVGILPVEVFLHNETDQPIRINLNTIQLEVHVRNGGLQEIDWLPVEVVASAVAHPGGTPAPSVRRFPIGIPMPGKDNKAEKLADILRPLALDADIIPPTGTIHGFLFFNMSHDMSLAASSSLYVPDAKVITTNKPLMFFEVPLGKGPQP